MRAAVATDEANALAALTAEAKHASDRLRLYQARATTGRAFDPTRMRDLERTAQSARERLDFAKREAAVPPARP